MTKENSLQKQLGLFYAEMNERLKDLSREEQQQYLEGLVHAFDSMRRYAHPGILNPFDRECFTNFAKHLAYSKACDLGLDVDAKMKFLMEYYEGLEYGYAFAATVHVNSGLMLTRAHMDVLDDVLFTYRADSFAKGPLSIQLNTFNEKMEERLVDMLSPKEQQQYLEGLVHAFDSAVRHASHKILSPFDVEYFIGSAKSWAYSKTYHLKLDPEKWMRGLVESDSEGTFFTYESAATLQEAMGIPLDFDQQHTLMNVRAVFAIKQMEL